VAFDDPTAYWGDVFPHRVVYTVWVDSSVHAARVRMADGRILLTKPSFARCGRELDVSGIGDDSFAGVVRAFRSTTLECYPTDIYPVRYFAQFRIANVVMHTAVLAYSDDEFPRVSHLVYFAQIGENHLRAALSTE